MDKGIQDFISVISNTNFKIRSSLTNICEHVKTQVQEIAVRVNRSIVVFTPKESLFLGIDGSLSTEDPKSLLINQVDLFETLKIICNFSLYSFQNQIKNGFITLRGGHRVGLCGTAILNGNDIINISDISSINLRVAREVVGSSGKIFEKFGFDLGGTLVAGPPTSGKTTILRDIARKLSTTLLNGRLIKISVIDERCEIAAVYQGVPQKNIGLSDVMNGFPKADGIIRAVRTLSPQIVICDEVGTQEDAEAIKNSLNCGVGIVASIHARTGEEISRSKRIKNILNSGAIKRVILLENHVKPGTIKNMFEVENAIS
ncbi:MAG: hypothetical protein FWC41_05600 [Firmicutes bacterium]|nr:hypothetical protein [Bacillota bacterium]